MPKLKLIDNRGRTFVLTPGYIFGWTVTQGMTLTQWPSVNQVALSDVVHVELVGDDGSPISPLTAAEKSSDGS